MSEKEETPSQAPPKQTILNPAAIHLTKLADGGASFDFLISPFEIVTIPVAAQSVQDILRELTGGIEVARSIPHIDVPQGRRPQ